MANDVFVTTNHRRPYFHNLTLRALELSGFKPQVVVKPMLERYFECERLAKTDIYIMCDDDIIPAYQDTLSRLIDIMHDNKEYSQIGLAWRPDMQAEKGNSWTLTTDGRLWEMDHCGGCVAIRKGTIIIDKEYDEDMCYGDDRIVAQIARSNGYKIGIARDLWFHHLGINQSTYGTGND